MPIATNQYNPNYAVPPGWVLEERLDAHDISHAEFARRCGRSPKLISEIITGKAPLEPKTALQFEKVLGVDASIWLGIENNYQLHRAREAETRKATKFVDWANSFPVGELVKRGCFQKQKKDGDVTSKLLSFFGVASIDAWTARYERTNVAYRHSSTIQSDKLALITWLRLGEIQAESQDCANYNESKFKQTLQKIRELTRHQPVNEALQQATEYCNESGVALTLVQPLPKIALSGAARWISPRKAVIQLSARHKLDDDLWFSFFHEAAHILLHSKKSIFVDGNNSDNDKIEAEADAWAANMLVPKKLWAGFVAERPNNEQALRKFADQQGIAPGIVIGMLQHQGALPQSSFNELKVRYQWGACH